MIPKTLVITPTNHINGVNEILESFAEVSYLEDPTIQELLEVVHLYDYIFTNPNKSKIFLNKDIIDAAINLKCICTASTGTNHIDKEYATSKEIKVISLTEERETINKIGSTAELAFALTISSLRNVIHSHQGALQGEWDYSKYIGRQLNSLSICVVGYGRLGKFYASYFEPFESKVRVFDPYKNILDFEQTADLESLIKVSDVLSLHVHVTDETINLINSKSLLDAKEDILIINTSRGEIINEEDMVLFLEKNKKARLATDVLRDEIRDRKNSPLLEYAKTSDQVVITQHIGGMTKEAQEIAYRRAASLLNEFLF